MPLVLAAVVAWSIGGIILPASGGDGLATEMGAYALLA
jgi:hypothetical protein